MLGLPGQVEPLQLTVGAQLRKGAEVVLQDIVGRPELDGAHAWVVDYSHERHGMVEGHKFGSRTGLYELDLEASA